MADKFDITKAIRRICDQCTRAFDMGAYQHRIPPAFHVMLMCAGMGFSREKWARIMHSVERVMLIRMA